jgi:hypothetical protein
MRGGSGLSEKITYSYYTSAQASQNTFYRLPRALYEKECFRGLSNDAKTLYALMLDRMSLSLANNWLDTDGKVYINYSLEDIMDTLNCGKTKAVALLKELDSESGIGLIEKKNMGIARASVFYVKNFVFEEEKIAVEGEARSNTGSNVSSEAVDNELVNVDKSVSRVQNVNTEGHAVFENRTHACSENEPDRVQILNPNKNNLNNTYLSNTNHILSINPTLDDGIDEMEVYSEIIKENTDYDSLLMAHPYDHEMVEGIYNLILETVLSKNEQIVVAGDVYPKNLVKSKFLKLNYSHVEYVIACLGKNTTKVRNIKSYLLASLFNAGSTISSYYRAEVNHDMPQYAG